MMHHEYVYASLRHSRLPSDVRSFRSLEPSFSKNSGLAFYLTVRKLSAKGKAGTRSTDLGSAAGVQLSATVI